MRTVRAIAVKAYAVYAFLPQEQSCDVMQCCFDARNATRT